MALVERVVVILMMMAAIQVSFVAMYKVGDSAGWTINGNIDYKKWSATKNFHVGDIIIFEYNTQFHIVIKVTLAMYKSCNTSSPLNTFSGGNDSIKITNHGHHFFLCGFLGHCQSGQKVDINVLKVSPAPAPTPSASAMASPVPAANVPAPSPNIAAPLIDLNGVFYVMGSAMTLLALVVSS